MISEAKAFWDPISGKVKEQINEQMGNALQVQRYDVTTDPDGIVMGVTQPFGSNEIFLPYSKEVAGATVGDTVLVAWWGSMSNARVYYFAKGYDGGAGGGDAVVASIVFPAVWTGSGNGYYTATPTIDGVTLSAESKIDLQITAAQFITLQADGVENLYVENDNAALTAYAVGGYPSTAITLQCTITGTNAPTPPVNPALDMIYPVGSIYINVNNVNPGNLIGGTWERIQDTFLLAAGSTYAGGSTGGEAEHTLTVDEIPEHEHTMTSYYDDANYNHGTIPADNGNYSLPYDGGTTSTRTQHTNMTGGGLAHNNMPPYLAVFVWKRTA